MLSIRQALSKAQTFCALLALAFTCNQVRSDVVSFASIPSAVSANDMSPDGRFIVGSRVDPQSFEQRGYLYDSVTGSMTLLPPECVEPVAVSDNGTAIVGSIYINEETLEEVAAIWTAASGVWTSLGYLPNAGTCPSRSNGYEISADGSVVVGLSWDGCSGRGFKWTAAGGMVELQSMANGGNRASVVSANGQLIAGFAQGTFERTPAYWTRGNTGHLISPSGNMTGEIHGINEAGTIMLGERNGKAASWTYPDLVTDIIGNGSLLPGWTGIATDIADDGTVVGFDFLIGNRRAWLARPGVGPCIDLKAYIESNGGVMPAGVNLEVCQAISNDGRTIIGHSSASGAWIVKIAPPCPADIAPAVKDNQVNTDDLLVVIGSWGPCAGPICPGDIVPPAHDGLVNTDDLIAVITGWGACPLPVGACCTGTACAQLTQTACLAAGGTYLGNSVPCSVNTCVNNDSCANAINITNKINNGTTNGDNSTATPPIFGGHDPELPLGTPTCQWNGNAEAPHSSVWYTFVAPANGSVTISLCTSTAVPFFDSLMALYEGECGSPKMNQVACDEDGCAAEPEPPFFSRIQTSSLTPGQTYRLVVMNTGDYNGSQPGPFKLVITSP